MLHLTYTGVYAGHPICDCDKDKAREAGDTFVHAVYAPKAAFNDPNTCPVCLERWNGADADGE